LNYFYAAYTDPLSPLPSSPAPCLSLVQAVVVESVEDFMDELLFGDHMDTAVVLKDGIRKLDMDDAMPVDIRKVSS
jgi:hypothetical protein